MSNQTSDEKQALAEDENMIEFNYINIIKDNSSELSVINDFVHQRKNNISLLKHPLLQAMVMMKWRTFQWLWLIELLLQLLFTILMFSIGTTVLKIEPNNCFENTTVKENLTRTDLQFHNNQTTAAITILASILWVFYVVVEIVQFTFSTIEIFQNLKTWWKKICEREEPQELDIEKIGGQNRTKISKIIRNFYFPIPRYFKEMENWLQLVIIVIR